LLWLYLFLRSGRSVNFIKTESLHISTNILHVDLFIRRELEHTSDIISSATPCVHSNIASQLLKLNHKSNSKKPKTLVTFHRRGPARVAGFCLIPSSTRHLHRTRSKTKNQKLLNFKSTNKSKIEIFSTKY